jgi:hypothetical protein
MGQCIGYLTNRLPSGLGACQQIAQGTDAVSQCVALILAGRTADAKGMCVQAAMAGIDGFLSDCLLGLTGQSYWGGTSCRLYYEAN